MVFNTNVKNAKTEDFLIINIISTAVTFKVLCCFLICYSVFWWHAMKSDSNPVFLMYGTVFTFFALINKKNIMNCVMTNKII